METGESGCEVSEMQISGQRGLAATTVANPLITRGIIDLSRPERKAGDLLNIKLPGGENMTFAWCPPGSFLMGYQPLKHGDHEEAQPAHMVNITKGYYISKNPVTRGQFGQFIEKTAYTTQPELCGGGYRWIGDYWEQDAACAWHSPGYPQDYDHPVVVVSWNDAKAFCKWIQSSVNYLARLPTEAEWEYSCRAGTETEFHYGKTERVDMMNCWESHKDQCPEKTSRIGSYASNPWGIYDMHGNISEWCEDYHDTYSGNPQIDPTGPDHCKCTLFPNSRIIRGGSFNLDDFLCSATYRHFEEQDKGSYHIGFRVVLVEKMSA